MNIVAHTIGAAGLFATTTIQPASADMRHTGQFGQWQTLAGTNKEGTPMCEISLDDRNRALMLKYQSSYDGLIVHLWKPGWQIPKDQAVKVVMQIDQAPPYAFPGTGDGKLLELSISGTATWDDDGKPAVEELVNMFADGRQLSVYFPDGAELPWQGSLTGFRGALASFWGCVSSTGPATQPFGAAPAKTAPTQPFGAQPGNIPAPATNRREITG